MKIHINELVQALKSLGFVIMREENSSRLYLYDIDDPDFRCTYCGRFYRKSEASCESCGAKT
jgi:rRNA maturation endonuclease Nob1